MHSQAAHHVLNTGITSMCSATGLDPPADGRQDAAHQQAHQRIHRQHRGAHAKAGVAAKDEGGVDRKPQRRCAQRLLPPCAQRLGEQRRAGQRPVVAVDAGFLAQAPGSA